MAAVTGSGLANPAAAYLPIVPADRGAMAFSAACGARPVAELAVEEARSAVECHVLDYGPGGLLAFQRSAVYRELGLRPPTLEAVREALRNYASPARLAASDLAPAAGSPAARAEAVRALIDQAVGEAFGELAGRGADAAGARSRLHRAGRLAGGGGARAQHEPDRLLPAAAGRRSSASPSGSAPRSRLILGQPSRGTESGLPRY